LFNEPIDGKNNILKSLKFLEDVYIKGVISLDVIEKARAGRYADTTENRRLKRVGQQYGSKGNTEEKGQKKTKREETKKDIKDYSDKEISEFARNTTDENLKRASSGNDEKLRIAAKAEIVRREAEEKPKVEGSESTEIKDKNKSNNDLNTKEGIEAEIKRLREIDTDELEEIKKITEKIKELGKDRENLLKIQSNLRKIEFEEYRKDFESFSDKSREEMEKFYNESRSKIRKYLDIHFAQEVSLDLYVEEGFEDIRKFLSTGEVEEKKLSLSKGNDFHITKGSLKIAIEKLSKFIDDNKIDKSLCLNRRIKLEKAPFFGKLKEGEIYEDASFSSCSLKEEPIFGEFNIEILVKKDSPVANAGNGSELEYIIDKGSKFRVLKKSDTGMIVELL
jgi:hypothetical protein